MESTESHIEEKKEEFEVDDENDSVDETSFDQQHGVAVHDHADEDAIFDEQLRFSGIDAAYSEYDEDFEEDYLDEQPMKAIDRENGDDGDNESKISDEESAKAKSATKKVRTTATTLSETLLCSNTLQHSFPFRIHKSKGLVVRLKTGKYLPTKQCPRRHQHLQTVWTMTSSHSQWTGFACIWQMMNSGLDSAQIQKVSIVSR